MALFNDIADFKKYVGGGANVSLQLNSIEPIMHDVVRDHLSPYVGYASIKAILEASPSLAANQDPFWAMVKRPIALLTLHEYAKIGAIQLSELGLVRATTDTYQSAFQYQENAYKDFMLTKGYEALEELLLFLQKNAKPVSSQNPQGVYVWWLQSEGYTKHNEIMVQTAAQMRSIFGLDVSRYSYEILRGLLRDVEYYAIQAGLPKQFFDYLRTRLNSADLSPYELELIGLIRSAIVHFVIEEGIRRLWVKIEGRSVVHLSTSHQQSSRSETTGSADAVKLKIKHHEVWAVRHMARLRSFLWDNVSEFPLCFAITEGGTNTDADAWAKPVVVAPAVVKPKTIFGF